MKKTLWKVYFWIILITVMPTYLWQGSLRIWEIIDIIAKQYTNFLQRCSIFLSINILKFLSFNFSCVFKFEHFTHIIINNFVNDCSNVNNKFK